MGRFELEPKLKEEIRARVLGEGFMKIVQTVRRNGKQFKIAMRPVEIGGEKKFQAEMTDDGQVQVKNLTANAAAEGLEEIIAQRGARDLHLMTSKGDHKRVTSLISGATYSDAQIREAMSQCHAANGYILDPHGACGYRALSEQLQPGEYGVFCETAHPSQASPTRQARMPSP